MSEALERTGDLTRDEIIGTAAEHSEPAREALHDHDLAKDALARGDAQELFVLYQKAIRRRNEVTRMFETIVAHYMGKNDQPRLSDPDSIASMRDVALGAIALAKSIVERNGTGSK